MLSVVVIVAAYPNWHKAPERFGSALKERRERERERTADSSNLLSLFVCVQGFSQKYLIVLARVRITNRRGRMRVWC